MEKISTHRQRLSESDRRQRFVQLDTVLKSKWDLSDAEIARSLGKSRSLPKKWRDGVSNPDEDDLNRLAELAANLEIAGGSTPVLQVTKPEAAREHPMELLGRLGQAIEAAESDLAIARRHYGALRALLAHEAGPKEIKSSSSPPSDAAKLLAKAAEEGADQ